VTPGPQHGDAAGDAFLAIQKLARRTGADVQELLTLYALEGLVARVAASRYREDFVLKGGVLLAAFSLRRPTKDVDLQATGLANDVDEVLERVRELAAIDVDDGLTFDPNEIRGHTIREDDGYPGVRIRLVAALGKARLTIGIDVNFGDPIWPAPTEIDLPRLIDMGQRPLRVLGYPLPMVVAEKIVTALQRGEANTRWRDFADVLTISCAHDLSAGELRAAFEAVATFRETTLRPLLPGLGRMPETAQAKWSNWRRRQSRASDLPEQFDEVLRAVAAFIDPVLNPAAPNAGSRWQSVQQTWVDRTG
jgi:hypothetical protein